jgi:tetratricopeptide (TPR) repeat protein
LHPRYRTPRPLDDLLLKVNASRDDWATEQYADQIGAILDEWSSGLLRSPQDLSAIEKSLAADFLGSSPRPVESHSPRQAGAIEILQSTFSKDRRLGPVAFLQDLRSGWDDLTKTLTAEFQVTRIEVHPADTGASPTRIQTRIRYEVVATGLEVNREQRVGSWELAWDWPLRGPGTIREWQTIEETRSRSASPVFVDVTANALGRNSSYSSQLLRGTDYWRTVLDGACGIDIYGHNGVSVGDIDGDGWDDLYVCQPGGLPNRLFRNRGDGTFEDITESSGVGVLENTSCALFVDVDNDGRQDLIVVRATGPMLFINQGDRTFRQKANAFHFANPPQGTFTGASVADYDRDGWLDIYFCLYVYYQGAEQYRYPSPYYAAENGPPNFMMRNNRDGTFSDVTEPCGLQQNNKRYSFCCGWGDFNGDGWPDLYVVNDFGRKNLYRNNGNGTFTDIAASAGVQDVGAGMSVCWFDCNNDGAEDLYVGNMWTAAGERIAGQAKFKKDAKPEIRALYQKHAMGNSLFLSNGQGFTDTTWKSGAGIGRWAWSSDSWDFDHDGFSDLYIANGMVTGPPCENNTKATDLNSFFWRQVVAASPEEPKPSAAYEQAWSAINELIRADGTWSGHERNVFYANNGDGTFSDVSGAIGLDFVEDGRAFAVADLDGDGRQELILKNRNAPQLRILKNMVPHLAPSISFRLRGTKSNRDAVGAVVTIETESGRQVRSLQAGSGFLSQHSKDILFGLGSATGPVRATIRWPSGLVQKLRDLPPNCRISIEEGAAPTRIDPFQPMPGQGGLARKDAAPRGAEGTLCESLPTRTETWLLAPVEAPDFSLPDRAGRVWRLSSLRGRPVLIHFWSIADDHYEEDWIQFNERHSAWTDAGLQILSVNLDAEHTVGIQSLLQNRQLPFPVIRASEDVGAVYNIVYRNLFDRQRDLTLPTSLLINPRGEIVKLYQGAVEAEHVAADFMRIPQSVSERLERALPFAGVTDAIEYGRNYLSYGSMFFQRGYMDQADSSFRIALRDDPNSAEALYGIGIVAFNKQNNAHARESFERALTLHASYPDTFSNSWNNLGIIAAQEGRVEEAIGNFLKALELSPDHRIALDNLGSAYRQHKQWEQALVTYQHALEIAPDDADANYGMAMVFAQKDDTVRAFEFLQKALTLRPAYPEALNNLGILYLRTQRRDEAVATLERCIGAAPGFDQCYLTLARVYAVEENPDQARSLLLELLRRRPGHTGAKAMLDQLGP